MAFPWAPVISAGASLLGGLLGSDDADDAREQQMEIHEQNIALQREFAKNGIQWRVADAQAAGIHPLYAIGGGGASFTPGSIHIGSDNSWGNALGSAGQDIGRAIDATRTADEKADRDDLLFTRRQRELQLENMSLENDLLRSRIAKDNQNQSSPPLPGASPYMIPGQTQSGLVRNKALERVGPASAAPSQEPGAVTDSGVSYTASGGYAPMMSKDTKERLEEDALGTFGWNWRNRILPAFGSNMNPPPVELKDGYMWRFNVMRQEYEQVPARKALSPADWGRRVQHNMNSRNFGGR